MDDIELGNLGEGGAGMKELTEFQAKVASIKAAINEINDTTQSIDKKYADYMATIKNKKKLKGMYA